MIQKFKTKRDRNGNTYTLVIDHSKQGYARNYNPWDTSEYIEIGKRDREKMIAQLEEAGYTAGLM